MKVFLMFMSGFFIFVSSTYSQENIIGNSYLWQENIKTQFQKLQTSKRQKPKTSKAHTLKSSKT